MIFLKKIERLGLMQHAKKIFFSIFVRPHLAKKNPWNENYPNGVCQTHS